MHTGGHDISELTGELLLKFFQPPPNHSFQVRTYSGFKVLSLQAGNRMLVAKAAARRICSLYPSSSTFLPSKSVVVAQSHPAFDILITDEVPELFDCGITSTDAGHVVQGKVRCWNAGLTRLWAWNEEAASVHSLEIMPLTAYWDSSKQTVFNFAATLPPSLLNLSQSDPSLPGPANIVFQGSTGQWFSAFARYNHLC